MLNMLHLRKIDLADRVLVVNPGGYIGKSMGKEIAYARATASRCRSLILSDTPRAA